MHVDIHIYLLHETMITWLGKERKNIRSIISVYSCAVWSQHQIKSLIGLIFTWFEIPNKTQYIIASWIFKFTVVSLHGWICLFLYGI